MGAPSRHLAGGVITREQWLLNETRIVARLRLDGMSAKNAAEKAVSENLFQYPTERELKSISRACNMRIDSLGSERLVRLIAEGLPEAAVQANLYAMMCAYPLVRDFMVGEVGRHYSELDYAYTRTDINAYFTHLAVDYDNIAKLSEKTVAKLKQVLRRCLVECGMLASARSEKLIPIFVDPDVREAIEAKGDFDALPAFNCIGGF